MGNGVLNSGCSAHAALQNNRQFRARASPAPRTTTSSAMALLEPGRSSRSFAYLRAAQAYMLISMPTGTSTIFGVFQAIRELQVRGTITALKYGKATPKLAQASAFFSRSSRMN
jgi:hypothetical protein